MSGGPRDAGVRPGPLLPLCPFLVLGGSECTEGAAAATPPPHPPYLPHAPGAVDARQHSWVWAWGLGSPEKEVCMRSSDRGPSPPCLPMGLSSVPAVRRLARKRGSDGHEDPLPLSLSYKVHVASVNNFPTAAGLASSAAGYACLGGCPGWVPVLCPRHSAVALAVSYV